MIVTNLPYGVHDVVVQAIVDGNVYVTHGTFVGTGFDVNFDISKGEIEIIEGLDSDNHVVDTMFINRYLRVLGKMIGKLHRKIPDDVQIYVDGMLLMQNVDYYVK